jgi:hypothetical protein
LNTPNNHNQNHKYATQKNKSFFLHISTPM